VENGHFEPVDTRAFPQTLRITFHYDADGQITKVVRKTFEMIAPGSPGPPPVENEDVGTWVELRDVKNTTLFHQLVHDPFQTHAEVYSPEGTIEAFDRPPQAGQFDVLLPAMDAAEDLALISGGGAGPDERIRPGRVVIQIPLDEIPPDEPERKK